MDEGNQKLLLSMAQKMARPDYETMRKG